MSAALATLPWVESQTIAADRKTRQVKFTVKERAEFDPEKVKEVISKHGYSGAAVLKGPTDS